MSCCCDQSIEISRYTPTGYFHLFSIKDDVPFYENWRYSFHIPENSNEGGSATAKVTGDHIFATFSTHVENKTGYDHSLSRFDANKKVYWHLELNNSYCHVIDARNDEALVFDNYYIRKYDADGNLVADKGFQPSYYSGCMLPNGGFVLAFNSSTTGIYDTEGEGIYFITPGAARSVAADDNYIYLLHMNPSDKKATALSVYDHEGNELALLSSFVEGQAPATWLSVNENGSNDGCYVNYSPFAGPPYGVFHFDADLNLVWHKNSSPLPVGMGGNLFPEPTGDGFIMNGALRILRFDSSGDLVYQNLVYDYGLPSSRLDFMGDNIITAGQSQLFPLS